MNGWLLALLITAVILGILLLLRLGLRVEYFSGETRVLLCVNRLRIKLYSSAEKKAKKQKQKKKSRTKTVGKASGGKKEKKKKDKTELLNILSLIREGGGVVARLIKRIRVEELQGVVTVCGADAASAAIAYGRLWAAVGAVHALLDNLVTVKDFQVNVLLDYEDKKTHAEGIVEIGFRNLYVLAAIYGIVKALWGYKNVFRGSGGSPRKLTKKAAADAVSGGDAAAE